MNALNKDDMNNGNTNLNKILSSQCKRNLRTIFRRLRDCAIIDWRGRGCVWKISGGCTGEDDNKRDWGLDVKFNTYRGALLIHSFLQTGKVVEKFEFKYKY